MLGLPNQTYNTFLESYKDTLELKPDSINVFNMQILNNTKLKQELDKYEIKTNDKNIVISTSSMTNEEIHRASLLSHTTSKEYELSRKYWGNNLFSHFH